VSAGKYKNAPAICRGRKDSLLLAFCLSLTALRAGKVFSNRSQYSIERGFVKFQVTCTFAALRSISLGCISACASPVPTAGWCTTGTGEKLSSGQLVISTSWWLSLSKPSEEKSAPSFGKISTYPTGTMSLTLEMTSGWFSLRDAPNAYFASFDNTYQNSLEQRA
jgi:hypothetical protein